MQYRNLGKWGLKISEIGLGSWVTRLDDADRTRVAQEVAQQAFDNGVNFFDCADAYNGGESERFLGRILSQFPREEYVVSSKVFFPVGEGPNDRGLSRKHIISQIDKSLKNLQVDYLDLYFCHRPDPETPLEETLQVMSDLVAAGKVLYWGVSEWTPVQITKALGLIREMGLRPLSVIQPEYNMVDRYIEDELVDICHENGIGITPFSPLAQGLLTGKYRKGQPLPAGSRATWQSDHQINDLLTDDHLDKVERLLKVADGLGVSLSVLALAWDLRLPEVSSVIAGASKPSQLESNLAAAGFKIPADALAEIEAILDYHPFRRHIG
ncbi:oxidoreductase aldo/keto reductase family protein [Bifidobacterium goeldii]|uniref:Oxidoreductase aldo/keto reductase family protein n=1 Tax=Bifidobacterium goeldii TaxID=2306975 RepID=A0A430FGY8_9BIFI|nr:aldo/keto reductase family protein [Bifidobacterium goeldii]RSX52133.1 oxidoreductase aldo/keto reductase family protein [Bifidobacterium goeldii]